MPRKPEPKDEMTIWNFYCPKLLKAEFMKELITNGHMKAQSSAVRALMEMYVNGDIDKDKFNDALNKNRVYNKDGSTSLM